MRYSKRLLCALPVLALLSFASCTHQPTPPGAPVRDTSFISVDTANRMIGSYLASVASDSGSVHALILDANALRRYLTSDSGQNITHVKLMLAHSLEYINSGHAGQNCGYQSGALTVVVAGYDTSGNYIYRTGRTVLDHDDFCPAYCPSAGTASADLLQ